MEALINEEVLVKIVRREIKAEKEKIAEGRVIGIEEFRKVYCGNKGAEWVRVNIFDEFPEVDAANGGWVVNPHNGLKTLIFEKRGAKWLENNMPRINWSASL